METDTLTVQQAFEAMRHFLAQFNEREPPNRQETIMFLLQWTRQDLHQDGGTSDPAQWQDWLTAVEAARRGDPVSTD